MRQEFKYIVEFDTVAYNKEDVITEFKLKYPHLHKNDEDYIIFCSDYNKSTNKRRYQICQITAT